MFRQAAPSRKRNRFTHAVEELGSRILRGDLKPGEILPNEAKLGRQLRASRTVVREAVKSLAAKGLLEPRIRTGTRAIRDRHPEQARENMAQLLTGTREFLERELAGPVHEGVEEARTAARWGGTRSTQFS